MAIEKKKYVELPTPYIIENGITVGDDWLPKPNHDSWLVPEDEYVKIMGRPN